MEHYVIAGSYIHSIHQMQELIKDGWEIEKGNMSITLIGAVLKIHMVKNVEDNPKEPETTVEDNIKSEIVGSEVKEDLVVEDKPTPTNPRTVKRKTKVTTES